MNIYGLDLSMTKTGIAILSEEGELIHSELVKPRANLSHGNKLSIYKDAFNRLIGEYEPLIVGIENAFTRHNTSTQVIYRVHGVANMIFAKYKQKYYQATTVKKNMTGSGRAKKHDVMRAVYEKYGVRVSEDEADAIAVAYCVYLDLQK